MLKRGNRRQSSTYLTDLDFADDIALFSETQENAQTMLNDIERVALKIGLKINRTKTEYILVGNGDAPVSLTISSGPIKKVDDFKYLGSWLKVREALAWKAALRLVKIWKSKVISRKVKLKLFLACVESTLLYNAVTDSPRSWTVAILDYFATA